MGCSCDSGGTTKAAEPSNAALKQSFRRFWPDHVPFPPVAPWLGASVTRVEAFDYVLRYAKRFPGLEHGEFAAYAALASSILYSEEAEFAAVRKAKKGGDGGGGWSDLCNKCYNQACSECGGCGWVFSWSCEDGLCRYLCEREIEPGRV